MLRNDPYFGAGTFGFIPERAFIISKQLSELKDCGWKTKPEFSEYLEALEGIPKESDNSCATMEFFDELPVKFMDDYGRNLKKHVFDC